MARVKYEFRLICNLIMEIPDRILGSKGFRTAVVKEKKQAAILMNSCFNKIIHAQFLNLRDVEKNLTSLGSVNDASRFIVLLAN